MQALEVPEHHIALFYVDGKHVETLAPGRHVHWRFHRNIRAEVIDLRMQNVEVSGQEILTRDRVSLRVNLSASYRVVDPVLAHAKQSKPLDYLYRELQLGLRAAVGTRRLDELLDDKSVIDQVVSEHVRAKIDGYGMEQVSVGAKDTVLPGEIKAILSRVVEAQTAFSMGSWDADATYRLTPECHVAADPLAAARCSVLAVANSAPLPILVTWRTRSWRGDHLPAAG